MKRDRKDYWFDTHEHAERQFPQEVWGAQGKPHVWVMAERATHNGDTYELWDDRVWGFLLLKKNGEEVDQSGGTQAPPMVQHFPAVGIDGWHFNLPNERSRLFFAQG